MLLLLVLYAADPSCLAAVVKLTVWFTWRTDVHSRMCIV